MKKIYILLLLIIAIGGAIFLIASYTEKSWGVDKIEDEVVAQFQELIKSSPAKFNYTLLARRNRTVVKDGDAFQGFILYSASRGGIESHVRIWWRMDSGKTQLIRIEDVNSARPPLLIWEVMPRGSGR
jgi:hypothetical protein